MSSSEQISSSTVDRENPWPGLASFTEETRAFFFGREKETEELVRLIRRNTLTVLFGQSGLGKSSLLQAGAFPQLREADFLPLYLRLDHGIEVARASRPWSGSGMAVPAMMLHGQDARATSDHGQDAHATLADQVKAALVDAFKSVGADAPAPRADETLWEYFHRKDIDIWSAKNRLLTPVLAFDQFEEIFTLGRASDEQRERGRAFLTELADLVENRAPAELRAKFDSGELDIARYNFDKPSCQVVLSLREDFLPDLEGLKNEMRSIMQSRMRVKRLNGTQALEIVTRPAPHLLADSVAERVVEFVAGARGGSAERLAELEVEPALLSVICRELNERRRTLGQPQITADLVSGNRREILTDFYERSVADLPEAMRAFVEDHLLTKSGFRDNLALETALEFPGVTRPLIDTLVSRRLVRIEDRLGVQRVELTHDVLAEVIRASRDTRHQRLTLEETKQRERVTRRRMWIARTIAAALLVGLSGVSWIAWRAIRAERAQSELRVREAALRRQAETQELAARRKAYASDMIALQQALATENLGRARSLLNRQRPKPGQVDLRGWEWRYLWQFCQTEAQSAFAQLPSQVNSLAVSADGKWLAAGAVYDGGLSLWNLETRERIEVPSGNRMVRAAFSPRAPLIAIAHGTLKGTASEFGVTVWNLETRQAVRTLPLGGHAAGLFFSADGQILVTSTTNTQNAITLWRVADGSRIASHPTGPTDNQNRWSHFAVSADLTLAAYASRNDGKVRVVDLATGRERWSARAANERLLALRFSPDGRTLASGAGFTESAIRLWDAASGEPRGELTGHRRFVSQLAFLADGKTLVSGSGDQTVRVWDVATRQLLRTLRGHQTEIWSVAVLPDDRTVVSGAKDGSVLFWDLRTAEPTAATVFPDRPLAWRFDGSGNALIAAEAGGRLVRRTGRNFREETLLLDQPREGSTVVLDARLPLLARSAGVGQLSVWDWEKRVRVHEVAVGRSPAFPFRFVDSGRKLLLGSGRRDGLRLHEWDLAANRETRAWAMPAQYRLLTVSPDERQAFSFGWDGDSFHLNLITGRASRIELDLRRQPATQSAFSPDGRTFVATSEYGIARVIDVTTPARREIGSLTGSAVAVHSAAFSPDGKRLATGSSASEAMTIWDTEGYEPLLVLGAKGSAFQETAFSPDGNVLGSGSGVGAGGALTLWRAPSWAEIEKAEAAERTAAAKP